VLLLLFLLLLLLLLLLLVVLSESKNWLFVLCVLRYSWFAEFCWFGGVSD